MGYSGIREIMTPVLPRENRHRKSGIRNDKNWTNKEKILFLKKVALKNNHLHSGS